MADWLYIESSNIVDIYALSAALDCAAEKKRIVRSTIVSELLSQHPSIEEIGFPSSQDTLVKVDIDNSLSFDKKVEEICTLIGENYTKPDNLSLYQAVAHPHVLERLKEGKYALLYLKDNKSNSLDLLFLDEVCRMLMSRGIKIASIGDNVIPCIRGTLDLRGILTLSEILRAADSAPFLISNNDDLVGFANIRGVHSYHIEQNEAIIKCNGDNVSTPSQVSNKIFKNSL